MPRPKPLTPLHRIVESDAQLAAWNARRTREEALQRAVRRLLPRPVAERVFVTDGQGATLELSTGAGAIASVVRQRSPQLLAALARDGWQFSGIRLRVQPRHEARTPPKDDLRQWDSVATRPLAVLEAGIPPGPLKVALARLLKTR